MNIVMPWCEFGDFAGSTGEKRINYKTKKAKAYIYPYDWWTEKEFVYEINTPSGKPIKGKYKTRQEAKNFVDQWLKDNGWKLMEEKLGVLL